MFFMEVNQCVSGDSSSASVPLFLFAVFLSLSLCLSSFSTTHFGRESEELGHGSCRHLLWDGVAHWILFQINTGCLCSSSRAETGIEALGHFFLKGKQACHAFPSGAVLLRFFFFFVFCFGVVLGSNPWP